MCRHFLLPDGSVAAVPHGPGRITTTVKVLKFLQLLKGIHTGPETVVSVREKLSFGDQSAKGLFHEFLTLLDVSEDFAPEYKETAVDPRPGFGDVFDALHNPLPVERNHMEACSRLHAHKAGQSFALHEPIDQFVEVHVAKSLAVVGKEYLLILEMFLDGFQPLPDVRIESGVHESDAPIMNIAVQQLNILATPGEHEIVGHAFVIVPEVVLDHIRLI